MAGLGLGLLGWWAWWQAGRAEVIELAGRDVAAAARLLVRDAGVDFSRCRSGATADDREHLLAALATLETFATSPLERFAERGVVAVAGLAGTPVPNWSFGPAQIRLSTARRALARAGKPMTPPEPVTGRRRIARRLLRLCPSRDIGLAVLQKEYGLAGKAGAALTLGDIERVAARYNGQDAAGDAKGQIANRIYVLLAYHLFQHYRFKALAHRPRERQ